MIRILVTGAAGNIGSALIERLLQFDDYVVVGVDNFLTGSQGKLSPREALRFTFIEADVNDPGQIGAIMNDRPFDFVFHYAAVVGVQRTLANPLKVLHDIQGIRNIVDLSRETGVQRVFYSSSSEVYGEPVEIPQHEWTTPLNSRLPYAIVKNVGEAFLRSYHKEYGLGFTVFRFFNTYGPKQSEDFVITRFIRKAMSGEPLTVYGKGTQTRTFCYIDDNIDTTLACLRRGLCLNDVMNVGSEEEITIRDLAERIIKVTGSPSVIHFAPPLKDGDMTRRRPDNRKMREILGRPLTTLDDGLRKTIEKLS